MNYSKLETIYLDREFSRHIACCNATFPSMEAQEEAFDMIEESFEEDPVFLVDFYDEEGTLTDSKWVSVAEIVWITGMTEEQLIAAGRANEERLSEEVRRLGR